METRLPFVVEARAKDSRARAARFQTLHGEVKTPLFMPVGTRATVRTQGFPTLEKAGSQVLLANTFHLFCRPGIEVFRKFGDIHRFMNWKNAVLTDSGGYQLFSLPEALPITEEGAVFVNPADSKRVVLTPELSIETQKAIGSDIMMVLDHCVPSTSPRPLVTEAMHRTFAWAKRSLDARGDSPQALFGIIQGACIPDLRQASAEQITSLPFDGFAVGGLAVGETRAERQDITEFTTALLPEGKPRYLMGVGTPLDLLEAVHRGIDMFDCILPVAWAQQGVTFSWEGRMDLRRGAFRLDEDPIEKDCVCDACTRHSRAYLNHLIKSKEVLGWQLIASHNLHFYHRLMNGMRDAILADEFLGFYKRMKPKLLGASAEDVPISFAHSVG